MSPLQNQLSHFAAELDWLDFSSARASRDYAHRFSASDRYGLNTSTVRDIEEHAIQSTNVAVHWLCDRVPRTGSVRVVFGEDSVFNSSTAFFLDNWPNLFMPCRDDVLILSNDHDWVLFYYHEDELHLGQRIR